MFAKMCAVTAVFIILTYLIVRQLRCRAGRKRLLSTPLPEQWKQIVEKNVPLCKCLREQLKDQLEGLLKVFVAEKKFEGCGGLEITDEIRVTIAAQACMLILNRKGTSFRKLRTILVYPNTYSTPTQSTDGNVTIEGRDVRLGESWQNGPVVLAWDSVTGGTANIADARNVVLHEFAHQLDQEDGSSDGAPILEHRSSYIVWARVLGKEYEALQKKKKKHKRSVMNKYGATNPAEFFAVATETFFEKAKQMKKRHPELYEELKDYYKLDPAEWG